MTRTVQYTDFFLSVSDFLVSVNRKRSAVKPDNIVLDNTHTHTQSDIAPLGISLYTSSVHRETESDILRYRAKMQRRRDWRKGRRRFTSGDLRSCHCLLTTVATRLKPAPVCSFGSHLNSRSMLGIWTNVHSTVARAFLLLLLLLFCANFV